jgi:alkylresorcinol/alkylpyrone synthase
MTQTSNALRGVAPGPAAASHHAGHQARLLSLATAVPDHVLDQSAVMSAALTLFDKAVHESDRLRSIYRNAAIGRRYSCVPLDWYLKPHGFAERNQLYIENALVLLERASLDCLGRAGLEIDDIDLLIVVSTSGIAAPSLDALLVERLHMRRDIQRLPIFGLGCAGGVIGLSRAAQLAIAAPGMRVLFLVVELCGLTFRMADHSKSNLIATALFGDGAAAALISTAGDGAILTDWGEHTWPGTLGVMGWRVEDDGFGVLFSRDIPNLVRTQLREPLDAFLRRTNLTVSGIDTFACHPGGSKVLDALEEVFGLPHGGLVAARRVLSDYGNMSAATVLFVLAETLKATARNARRCLLSSLGPGFSAAFLLLEGA